MPSSHPSTSVRFDRFELDLSREELLSEGVATPIQPQPLKLLVLLVAHAGKLVTRGQIQERLWSDLGTTDVNRSLNHTVRKLRQALGDDARNPRFIQTVPRRGYRFMGQLQEPLSDLSHLFGIAPMARPSNTDVVLTDEGSAPAVRLRISNFREITDDRAWPLLSEGVVEELITHLVGFRDSGLAVLDDTFRAEQPLTDAQRSFFGLRGCVRRSGAKVRVNAHLAQHPDGTMVATTAFEQELGSVFDLQGQASLQIVEDLIVPLLKATRPEPGTPEHDSPEHDL